MRKTFANVFVVASGMLMSLAVLCLIYFDSSEIGFTMFAASFVVGIIASILEG